MADLSTIFAVGLVALLGAISPGPDFFIVMKNSLSYSRRAGFWTSVGVSLALIVHLSYTIVGIGVVIAESPFLYSFIKYAGVSYLLYIGTKSIMPSFKQYPSMQLDYAQSRNQISSFAAITQGFLTNLLNPKAAIYFISLFSQFIDPNTPMFARFEYAFINWVIVLGWFLFLSYIITSQKLLGKISQFRLYIDRVMGGALILLGLKLLLV